MIVVNGKKRRATHVVDDSFAAGSKIDVLFISHFDFDHVSFIPYPSNLTS